MWCPPQGPTWLGQHSHEVGDDCPRGAATFAKLTLLFLGHLHLTPLPERAGEVLQVPAIQPNLQELGGEHSVRCGVCTLNHPTEDCIGRHKAKEAPPQSVRIGGRKHHAWNLSVLRGFAGCLSLACSNSFRPHGGKHRHQKTSGQPNINNSGNTASSLCSPTSQASLGQGHQTAFPLVPRDPTPVRGSGGRESEAQLTLSVEEAATINPRRISLPHCLNGRLGPGPRPPHRKTP
ncbi:hypothetical protein GWK47_016296 [Chionoecetes opilio]|uniref:Uncharacterized protein n=1 Tax=Chionoecetes opilio TaxID=41210 RepID=A0A8J5CHW5_CHIOP|nr:hypothetical protein GWK47_016296 [Chionoecetes opilio]